MIYGGYPGSVTLGGALSIAPANIVATNMVLDKNTCTAPCSVTVAVTWTNEGGTIGSFDAGVSVDGGTPILTPVPDILSPTESVTHSFTISMTTGRHTICPVPGDTTCQIIDVQSPPVSAGFPLLLGAGLLFGLLLKKKKECNDYITEKDCEKDNCQWLKEEKKCVPRCAKEYRLEKARIDGIKRPYKFECRPIKKR